MRSVRIQCVLLYHNVFCLNTYPQENTFYEQLPSTKKTLWQKTFWYDTTRFDRIHTARIHSDRMRQERIHSDTTHCDITLSKRTHHHNVLYPNAHILIPYTVIKDTPVDYIRREYILIPNIRREYILIQDIVINDTLIQPITLAADTLMQRITKDTLMQRIRLASNATHETSL